MGHRILVVDDEATIVHVLRTILTKNGCETRSAGSAEEALLLLDDWEPEVALLHIVLPGMNGIQFMGEVKERYPNTEVLIMTSNASSDTAPKTRSTRLPSIPRFVSCRLTAGEKTNDFPCFLRER